MNVLFQSIIEIMTHTLPTNILETLPPEVILHILSYLDLPDLDVLSHISPSLNVLAQDPILHKSRILIVAPSRVKHSLFGHGGTLRPTIPDLVQWGVLRGLGIERRWRMGVYLNSKESVKLYENSRRLQLSHVRHVLSTHLQRKSPTALARVLPDSEPCAPRLLPVIRRLKWCIRRDKLAQMVRDRDLGANIITVSRKQDIITRSRFGGNSKTSESGMGIRNELIGSKAGVMAYGRRMRGSGLPFVPEWANM